MSGRWLGALLLTALLVGLVWHVRRTARGGGELAPPTPTPPVGPTAPAPRPELTARSSADCETCHAEIAAEWRASPHSRPWGTHPLIPKNPRRTECSPCHIPKPIFETGLTNPVQVRADRHEEGVGCVTCHVRGNECLGAGPTREAPCNPAHSPAISTSEACRPCHALHGTLDEWKKTPFAARGEGCQHCHMPTVVRPLVTGGEPRKGHSHRMLGGRSPELLARALTVTSVVEGPQVVVTILNDGTGHAVPGEINNRRLDLVIAFTDAAGDPINEEDEFVRSFQAPPRPKRGLVPTTQIMAGETVRVTCPLPPGATRAEVTLEYRLFFLAPGRTIYRKQLPLGR